MTAFLPLLIATSACASTPSGAEPVPAASTPAPTREAKDMTEIHGTWTYAEDPTGAIPSEDIYEGSAITFGADGKYAFQLASTSFALEGTWTLTKAEGDTVQVHTEYGQGRKNDLTLKLRRDGSGAITGLEVREGDGSTGARYYARENG